MQRVILATDDSESALRAARLLGRLFDVTRLEITLVSVINLNTPPIALDSTCEITRLVDQARSQALAALEHVRFTLGVKQDALHHIVCDGHVGESIVSKANELDADLIVVGDRRHSSVGRVLLGSTSDYVATHAKCSVLVVRSDVADRLPGPLRIGIPVDPVEAPDRTLRMIERFADRNDAQVHLTSVLVPPIGQSPEVPLYWRHDQQAAQRVLDKIQRGSESLGVDTDQHVINATHISNGLVQHFVDRAVDLAVMNESNRTSLGRFLLGSVSRSVLRYAKCSVLISRLKHQNESASHTPRSVMHDSRDEAMT